jgi:hypothetical protein
MSSNFFTENRAVWDNVEKYGKAWQGTHALCIPDNQGMNTMATQTLQCYAIRTLPV